MKYLFLGFAVLLTINCGPKLPPNLQAIQNKDRLVNAIGVLQDAAIGASDPTTTHSNQLSINDARTIITFCNVALKNIRDGASNWKVLVINDLEAVKKLPSLSQFSSLINLIESLLAVL